MVSEKVYYFNDNDGKQRIANWYKEFVNSPSEKNTTMDIKFDIQKVKKGELTLNKPFEKFTRQLRNSQHWDDTFFYIIAHNKSKYGNQVLTDLFKRVYL